MLDGAVHAIAAGRAEEAREIIETALGRQRATIRELRDLSFVLEPVVLRDQGFVPALRALADRIGDAHGIRSTFDARHSRTPPSSRTRRREVALYTIIRELLEQSVRRGPPGADRDHRRGERRRQRRRDRRRRRRARAPPALARGDRGARAPAPRTLEVMRGERGTDVQRRRCPRTRPALAARDARMARDGARLRALRWSPAATRYASRGDAARSDASSRTTADARRARSALHRSGRRRQFWTLCSVAIVGSRASSTTAMPSLNAALMRTNGSHFSGSASSGKIASTGHSGSQAPQSMHSSGSIDEHPRRDVDAVDRADVDARLILDVDAGLSDHVGHRRDSTLPASEAVRSPPRGARRARISPPPGRSRRRGRVAARRCPCGS